MRPALRFFFLCFLAVLFARGAEAETTPSDQNASAPVPCVEVTKGAESDLELEPEGVPALIQLVKTNTDLEAVRNAWRSLGQAAEAQDLQDLLFVLETSKQASEEELTTQAIATSALAIFRLNDSLRRLPTMTATLRVAAMFVP